MPLEHRKLPVARDEGLLVEDVADETVIYDARTKEAHGLNPLATIVFRHCDGETTVGEAAALAAERLGKPVTPDEVMNAVAQLEDRELVDVPKPRGKGLSRREMMRKTAVAGAAAASLPVITTILAPTPAAAATQFCTEETLCKCCEFGTCACATNSGGQSCCKGQGCQCISASEGKKHCKPGNAPATTCNDVDAVCPAEGSGLPGECAPST